MPRKEESTVRSEIVRVRLTPKQLEQLKGLAEEEGESVADYIRMVLRFHIRDLEKERATKQVVE